MTLLVSHIPKTGGTSVKSLVDRFHPDAVFAYLRELAPGSPNIEFVRKLRVLGVAPVIMGHFPYGTHHLLGVAPIYATVLREPVSRVASLYRYQRSRAERGNAPPHDLFQAKLGKILRSGISLRAFVAAGMTEETNNHMCRLIAGISPDAGLVINDRWLLELALHNLRRHYQLIGTTEDLGSFLAALSARLKWGTSFEMPRENITPGKPLALDAETRAAIIDKNALDIELYEHVRTNSRPRP
jgi:hypothetical protein